MRKLLCHFFPCVFHLVWHFKSMTYFPMVIVQCDIFKVQMWLGISLERYKWYPIQVSILGLVELVTSDKIGTIWWRLVWPLCKYDMYKLRNGIKVYPNQKCGTCQEYKGGRLWYPTLTDKWLEYVVHGISHCLEMRSSLYNSSNRILIILLISSFRV